MTLSETGIGKIGQHLKDLSIPYYYDGFPTEICTTLIHLENLKLGYKSSENINLETIQKLTKLKSISLCGKYTFNRSIVEKLTHLTILDRKG